MIRGVQVTTNGTRVMYATTTTIASFTSRTTTTQTKSGYNERKVRYLMLVALC